MNSMSFDDYHAILTITSLGLRLGKKCVDWVCTFVFSLCAIHIGIVSHHHLMCPSGFSCLFLYSVASVFIVPFLLAFYPPCDICITSPSLRHAPAGEKKKNGDISEGFGESAFLFGIYLLVKHMPQW